jgi:hypothetical protein
LASLAMTVESNGRARQPPADASAKLGTEHVVLLTNRFPQNGYAYLAPHWSPEAGGFAVTLVETTLANGSVVEYAGASRTDLVDWVLVTR